MIWEPHEGCFVFPTSSPFMKYDTTALATFPWIVSNGTLRSEDLLPSFWQVAEQLGATIPSELLADLQTLVGADSTEADWSDELASDTVQTLFDVLGEVAPDGFCFGSSEGDGACFGFWLSEDWANAFSDRGIDCEDPAAAAELISELVDNGIDADNFADAYQGEATGWSESLAGADFAQQLAEDTGTINWSELQWPFTCIDWTDAWRELETSDGFFLIPAGGSSFYAFRSL